MHYTLDTKPAHLLTEWDRYYLAKRRYENGEKGAWKEMQEWEAKAKLRTTNSQLLGIRLGVRRRPPDYW